MLLVNYKVIIEEKEDLVRLYHSETGALYELDGVAKKIFTAFFVGKQPEDLIDELVVKDGFEREQAQKEVSEFVVSALEETILMEM